MAVTKGKSETTLAKPQVKETKNFATSIAAQTFAKEFAGQYLQWTVGKEKEREARLKPYLMKGVDSQAGLRFEGMQYNASPHKVDIWDVKSTGKNTALITLKTGSILTPVQGKKKDPSGPYTRFFAVPLTTDGQSFVVHDIPYYVTNPEPPAIEPNPTNVGGDTVTEEQTREEMGRFLDSFFKVYAMGNPEEIAYFTKATDMKGLKGIASFNQVEFYTITKEKGASTGEYRVQAKVRFTDGLSKGNISYPYELKVKKEQGRWFVLTLETKQTS
jgi:hypothetical protein